MLDPAYVQLRHLTTPVAAVTSSAAGRGNGQIVNSAQRASLVPSMPRISLYISKTNLTHELVYQSGVFGVHLLRTDQWDLIWHLGLQSGRDIDKLSSLDVRRGGSGCPMLVDCFAAYECRVINAMDAGAATFFLGDIVDSVRGTGEAVMTSEYFRANMAPERRIEYEGRLLEAQSYLEPLSRHVEPKLWPGPVSEP